MTDQATQAAPVSVSEGAVQYVVNTVQKYFFKKDKLGNRRPTLELPTPTATPHLVAEIYNRGGKGLDLLMESINAIFADHVRIQLNDETKPVMKVEDLDYSKLDYWYIASIPPAERKGAGIPAEIWEAFSTDYSTVMVGKIDKTAEQIATAATLFVKRLAPVKWRKPVLRQLQQYLDLWYSTTTEAEQFSEVYKFLSGKITEFLELKEEDAAMNI
jgi:hypothetical protein